MKNWEKEFNKMMGKPPAFLEEYRNSSCFICGQPFDKSPQVKQLKQFITKLLASERDKYKEELLTQLRNHTICHNCGATTDGMSDWCNDCLEQE